MSGVYGENVAEGLREFLTSTEGLLLLERVPPEGITCGFMPVESDEERANFPFIRLKGGCFVEQSIAGTKPLSELATARLIVEGHFAQFCEGAQSLHEFIAFLKKRVK